MIDLSTVDKTTLLSIYYILNYVTTYSNVKLLFKAIDMVLHAHSNGSYLYVPKAKSHGARYVFLWLEQSQNMVIEVFYQLCKVVVSSLLEAELVALLWVLNIAFPWDKPLSN